MYSDKEIEKLELMIEGVVSRHVQGDATEESLWKAIYEETDVSKDEDKDNLTLAIANVLDREKDNCEAEIDNIVNEVDELESEYDEEEEPDEYENNLYEAQNLESERDLWEDTLNTIESLIPAFEL